MKKLSTFLRRNFLAGLIVLIPIAVIVWIGKGIFKLFWRFRLLLPEQFNQGEPPPFFLEAVIFFGIVFVLLLSVALLGFASRHYLGQKTLKLIQKIIHRIPVLGTIYTSLDQILASLTDAGSGKKFSRVVYLEYPRKGSWAIGFVTSTISDRHVLRGHLNIFVPTVPNPTSGFHLIIPAEDVRETGLRVDEAFKIILSLGIAQPAEPKRRVR